MLLLVLKERETITVAGIVDLLGVTVRVAEGLMDYLEEADKVVAVVEEDGKWRVDRDKIKSLL